MLGKLTERQKRIINLIVDHIDEKGFPPTFREIGRSLRISSTNGVRSHLKAIEKRGILSFPQGPGP
jgi:repressor LexA